MAPAKMFAIRSAPDVFAIGKLDGSNSLPRGGRSFLISSKREQVPTLSHVSHVKAIQAVDTFPSSFTFAQSTPAANGCRL